LASNNKYIVSVIGVNSSINYIATEEEALIGICLAGVSVRLVEDITEALWVQEFFLVPSAS